MNFYEEPANCSCCGRFFKVEYVIGGTRQTSATTVQAPCPHCGMSVHAEVPLAAIVFCARSTDAPSVLPYLGTDTRGDALIESH